MTSASTAHVRWVGDLPDPAPRAEPACHELIAAVLRDAPGDWHALPDLPPSRTAAIRLAAAAGQPAMTAVPDDGLTYAQRKVLKAVGDYIVTYGYPPTLREIAAAVGLSGPSTASYHLGRLEAAGWVRRAPGRPRALVLVGGRV